MKRLSPSKEILMSWRRCMEKGINAGALSSALSIEGEELDYKLNESRLLSDIFYECAQRVTGMISNEHMLLLTDTEGMLIRKVPEIYRKKTFASRREWFLRKKGAAPMQLTFQYA